ncbi:MAG: hypothetical protein ACKPKO_40830, partial [Candidatus Fonsibacter sp.]
CHYAVLYLCLTWLFGGNINVNDITTTLMLFILYICVVLVCQSLLHCRYIFLSVHTPILLNS